jgi:hypothetical protein
MDIFGSTTDRPQAYDTVGVYEAAAGRGAKVVIPPTRTAAVSRRGPRSSGRDRTIKAVEEVGRRRWKKESGYHRQGRVENVFFRYKSIIGESLRARSPGGQRSKAVLACNILNQMTALGRPASYRIGG